MKNLFIGIDYSKKKFDVSLLEREKTEEIKHECFDSSFWEQKLQGSIKNLIFGES